MQRKTLFFFLHMTGLLKLNVAHVHCRKESTEAQHEPAAACSFANFKNKITDAKTTAEVTLK